MVKKIMLITSYDKNPVFRKLAQSLQDVKHSLLELDVE
ncbi:MAG: hypothetical protein ACI8YB_001331 [Patiriisocius sp.]|jgi:hypothetical protein